MSEALPKLMRAIALTGIGEIDRLQSVETRVPRPMAGEVLVKVGACGLNNSDVMLRIGGYGREDDPAARTGWKREAPQFPRIQGSDIAGTIVAVGEGVAAGRIGERVLVNPTLYLRGGDDPTEVDYLGSERDGGYAEYCAVPAENAVAVNSDLPFEDLATFPIAYLTAFHMLNRARLSNGERVVITGASGGVGSAMLQLAKLRGAEAIAVVGHGKVDKALALGAVATVDRDAPDLGASLQAAATGPIDVVADVAGGAAFSALLAALRPAGRFVTCGAIAGSVVPLDLRTVYLKHLEIIGSSYGTAAEFRDLVGLIESGRLRPLRAKTYPLDQLAEAQRAFIAKKHFGNIVVAP